MLERRSLYSNNNRHKALLPIGQRSNTYSVRTHALFAFSAGI